VAAGGAAFLLVRVLVPAHWGWAAVAAGAAGLGVLHYGVKAEQAMSQLRPYRVARHVFRLVVIGGPGLWYAAGLDSSWPPNLDDAFRDVSGSAMFAVPVAFVLMHFLFRALDRKLFPVRDRHAIAQEKKYAELTEDEVFAIKNAKFRAIAAFSLAWLAITIALMLVAREVPVALSAAAAFVMLWLLRNRLFFKSHRQRLAAAEELRAQRRDGAPLDAGQFVEGGRFVAANAGAPESSARRPP
jgi:hypothetical protein